MHQRKRHCVYLKRICANLTPKKTKKNGLRERLCDYRKQDFFVEVEKKMVEKLNKVRTKHRFQESVGYRVVTGTTNGECRCWAG